MNIRRFQMNADGSGATRLTGNPAVDRSADWKPYQIIAQWSAQRKSLADKICEAFGYLFNSTTLRTILGKTRLAVTSIEFLF